VSLALLVAAQFRVLGPWTAPIWSRLNRANRRLAALLAHLAAGRLPRRRSPRPSGTCRAPAARDPLAPEPLPALPRAHGWLVRIVGYHAAGRGSQLQVLLHDPATIAVLQAIPTIGRTLRPFCRLLGVTLPPVLQLPPRAPRPVRTPARDARPTQAAHNALQHKTARPKALPTRPPWHTPTAEQQPIVLPAADPPGTDTAGVEYSFQPT
jgi:hypothetical protein